MGTAQHNNGNGGVLYGKLESFCRFSRENHVLLESHPSQGGSTAGCC
jgi:hypothetical protein